MEADLESALAGRFRVERELGGGGMSRVFLAEELALRRRVVIKILPAEIAHAVSVDRFKREIALAARLVHPHIVTVLSAGEVNGRPYYVMPYVDGETLRARMTRAPLSIREAVRILRQIVSTPADPRVEMPEDRIEWMPEGASSPLVIDVAAYFAEVLDA